MDKITIGAAGGSGSKASTIEGVLITEKREKEKQLQKLANKVYVFILITWCLWTDSVQ
jgi:hypothetical protein